MKISQFFLRWSDCLSVLFLTAMTITLLVPLEDQRKLTLCYHLNSKEIKLGKKWLQNLFGFFLTRCHNLLHIAFLIIMAVPFSQKNCFISIVCPKSRCLSYWRRHCCCNFVVISLARSTTRHLLHVWKASKTWSIQQVGNKLSAEIKDIISDISYIWERQTINSVTGKSICMVL